MLPVGLIGIGNCGNQIAVLAKKKLNIPVIAMNTSSHDLEKVPEGIPIIKITNDVGESNGVGKDRELAKELMYFCASNFFSSEALSTLISQSKVVFVVGSTGGGTGCGIAPMIISVLEKQFPENRFILVGVTPVLNEALGSHSNTMNYLKELAEDFKCIDGTKAISKDGISISYMLYDNNNYAGEPSSVILPKINEEIVEDIDIIRCSHNFTTVLDSIDSQDMFRLLSFPGRIVVSRLSDFTEKDTDNEDIWDMLIENLKSNANAHVELERDGKIESFGLITNLSEKITKGFKYKDTKKLEAFIGSPNHSFDHIYINEDKSMPNHVDLILTGLSFPKDKIEKIQDRIDEIEKAQRGDDEVEDAFSRFKMDELDKKLSNDNTRVENVEDGFVIKDELMKFFKGKKPPSRNKRAVPSGKEENNTPKFSTTISYKQDME